MACNAGAQCLSGRCEVSFVAALGGETGFGEGEAYGFNRFIGQSVAVNDGGKGLPDSVVLFG